MMQRLAVVVIGIIIIASLTQTTYAQGRFRMTTEERVAMLKDSIALDTAQAAKITVILNQSDKKRQEIFEKSDGDRESMRDAMMTLMEKTDTQIKEVLKKGQKEKYEKMISERRARMGQRPN
jgi:hypothetical protein